MIQHPDPGNSQRQDRRNGPADSAARWAGAVAIALAATAPTAARAQSILEPETAGARSLATLYWVTFIVGVVVFFLVEGLIIYAAFRYRRRPGNEGEPEQIHGNTRLEIAWAIPPALIVLALAAFSMRPLVEAGSPPAEALRVEVTGKQWFWEFHYPEASVTTANELVLPVGQPVELEIGSTDVIHSFWVPRLAGKMDAVPRAEAGRPRNRMWFTIDTPGRYDGQCAELCGAQHAGMRFQVVAVTQEEFRTWLVAQARDAAAPPAGSDEARGLEVLTGSACAGCHRVDGVESMVGRVGPDLTHVGSRRLLAGGVLENTPDEMSRWIDDPAAVKPGTKMPDTNLSRDDIDSVVRYLESLK